MQSGAKMYTVDRFLGLNEAADGSTELKMGEATNMVNWTVTDGFNLSLRPGVARVDREGFREPGEILAMWAGYIGTGEYLLLVDIYDGSDRIWLYKEESGSYHWFAKVTNKLGLSGAEGETVKVVPMGDTVYVMSTGKSVAWDGETFAEAEPYVPLVITGANPAGGGTQLENLNMLCAERRVDYSPDGTATEFWLPEEATGVEWVSVDNVRKPAAEYGSFNAQKQAFVFSKAPAKGVGNVEITYTTDAEQAHASAQTILKMPLVEAYNGSTDTRIFVAGDGSNICYYSGVTLEGKATPMYFPAMNEVAVDMSDSPITAIVRHYSKLLVFKPDGTFTITYEPVTLADGSTIAGFYLRSANREFGCDVLGQVQTVDNYPRTLSRGGIYEWKITSSYYKDERYAKRVSEKVERTLAKGNRNKMVTCDNTAKRSYYVFLNDSEGTVLVSRYGLMNEDIWCCYKSERFKNVRKAVAMNGKLLFANDREAFWLNDQSAEDAGETIGSDTLAIGANWESGFMDFGADFRRKYSSTVYVSLKPESNAEMTVTAATDRRSEYLEKVLQSSLFSWLDANFENWTFDTNDTPKIRKVRLKVKKFVYYKLIFRITKKGARATVLGYDQQVRFGSTAK